MKPKKVGQIKLWWELVDTEGRVLTERLPVTLVVKAGEYGLEFSSKGTGWAKVIRKGFGVRVHLYLRRKGEEPWRTVTSAVVVGLTLKDVYRPTVSLTGVLPV